jgi:hypothetical protein
MQTKYGGNNINKIVLSGSAFSLSRIKGLNPINARMIIAFPPNKEIETTQINPMINSYKNV